jgi:hypothetical protein
MPRRRIKRSKTERISRLKDKAHTLLKKEAILETKISLLQNRHETTRRRRVKIQEQFRKLER